jgi:hypothetical protein
MDATFFTERGDHVNTFPSAGEAELWVQNTAIQRVRLTDDAGADNYVMLHDATEPAAEGVIPVWNNTTKRWTVPAETFALQTSATELKHLPATGAIFTQTESSTGPGGTSGRGKWWVKNTAPSTPWFTQDNSNARMLLHEQDIQFTGVFVNGTGGNWYGPNEANGGVNYPLWSDAFGSGANPATTFPNFGHMFNAPGTIRRIRMVWYSAGNPDVTFQLRLMTPSDGSTTWGTDALIKSWTDTTSGVKTETYTTTTFTTSTVAAGDMVIPYMQETTTVKTDGNVSCSFVITWTPDDDAA